MPRFIWRARDKLGKPVVQEIAATTCEESRAALLAAGCTDLVLIQDEVGETALQGMPSTITVMGKEVTVTAAESAAHIGKPSPTYLSALREGVVHSKLLVLTIIALGAYAIYRGQTISAVLLGLALIAWLTFIVCVSLPAIYYDRLNKAVDWARWSEVLDLVEKLERLRSIHFIKIPLPELGRQRAHALAGLGRLTEALADYRQFEDQPGCPSWLHKAYSVSIFDTAKQHGEALECLRKAIEENPIPMLYLDLANQLARYHRDPVQAREALAEAEQATLPEMLGPFLIRCRGILAYLEGDHAAARKELEQSIKLMEQTRHVAGRDGNIRVAKGYLCCVLGKLGDLPAARQNYLEAKDYLAATEETELIEECQRALGSTTLVF